MVTGAAGGMGRHLAIQLSQDNCPIAICDIRLEALEETKRLCLKANPRAPLISTHLCDVADEENVTRFHTEVLEAHGGRVDVLINNAGIYSGASFLEMPAERFQKVFDISIKGTILCTRVFLPDIVKSKRGYVANLSSINALWCSLGPAKWPIQVPPHAAYCSVRKL